ncbi:MAG: FAD-binding oxidoreductase [Gemmatimonadales bacterium]
MAPPPGFLGVWREDPRARAAYSEGAGIYRILPSAVAVPSTTRDLIWLVSWAHTSRTPLVPRGAGSGMPGHNVGPGVILDLTALDGRPLEVDAERLLATTGAAVSLGELAEEARKHGLRMPVDPSSARWATAGGVAATNAAGPRSVKYGPVRRWIQALKLVTADGELVELERDREPADSTLLRRFRDAADSTMRLARWRVASSFPKVRKNTAGYALDAYLASGDLLDLIIGSEGTLALITEVTWRLEPIPPARAAVRAAVRDARRLSHCVPALLSLAPARLEFLDASFLRFVADEIPDLPRSEELAGRGALLLAEFEGSDEAELEALVERAVGILKAESVEVVVGRGERELEGLWAVRRSASSKLARLGPTRRSLQVIEDGCVGVDRLGDYLAAVRRSAERLGLEVVLFGHAGDANVHANVLADVSRPDLEDALTELYDEVSRLLIGQGGTPAGEHGDGRLRAPLLERVYGWEMTQLFQQLKRTFDPAGVLNPGVKLTERTGSPIYSLKVGPHAVPIPADIEAGLRWIEQQRGYAADRLVLADDPSSWSARELD